jgi:outer membrane receptor protein involved in Fe transport
MGRYDHHFNDRQRLSGIVTFERGRDFTSTNGFDPPAEVGNLTRFRIDQNYVADYTHILSPSTVFNVHASFGRYTEFLPDSSGESDLTACALGMTNMVHAPTVDSEAPPSFNLDLYNSIIGNTYSWATQNQWSVHPGIVHNRGRHVIHYGFEFAYAGIGKCGTGARQRRVQPDARLDAAVRESFARAARRRGCRGSAVGPAISGFVDYNDSAYRTWPYYALYFQDTWRVTKNVTLTMGLRYDVQIPLSSVSIASIPVSIMAR